jgi:hypothetical protein
VENNTPQSMDAVEECLLYHQTALLLFIKGHGYDRKQIFIAQRTLY